MTRWILKARRLAPAAPSAAQMDRERTLWGPHPDPVIAQVEEAFYKVGETFLGTLYQAVTAETRTLAKADGGLNTTGWGELAKMFSAPADNPTHLVATWADLVNHLTAKLLPAKEDEARLWALRSHLLSRLGDSVMTLGMEELEHEAKVWSPRGQEALAWTKASGMEFLTEIEQEARVNVRRTMMACRLNGYNTGQFKQRLFEKFSEQNRDWRRVAITETSFAVNNSKLASVDPAEGWDAIWGAGPNACPFCKAMHHRRFRIVDAAKEGKDGDNELWVGKSNRFRSAHKWSRKEKRERVKVEMWWPCAPVHPNCICSYTLVRAKPPVVASR